MAQKGSCSFMLIMQLYDMHARVCAAMPGTRGAVRLSEQHVEPLWFSIYPQAHVT